MVDLTADTARRTFRTLEPCHAFVYFEPEPAAEYAALGLRDHQGYFASRSAPMGAVGPEVVVATFYNFNPELVRSAMAGVWGRVSPTDVLAARLRGADAALCRLLGDAVGSEPMRAAAELARACAEEARHHPEGRPLFAGHAELPWPEPAHLVLWHAQTLLREFRGDGHVAALVLDGCSGLEALVVHAATGEASRPVLQATRAWSDDEWDDAVRRLVERGWLEEGGGALTDEGARRRAEVEATTDRLATAPYAAIGDDGCAELRRLVRPFSQAIVAAWSVPGR